jgi:pyridoxine 4-dehydrogenase
MSISKTITIAGKSNNPLTVNRLGYGTMRLTGEGIYGEPSNRPEALQILKQAISSGINFIDTADYYGEDVTNRLIAEALHPYPADLVICTKVGGARKPDKSWIPYNTPENLRSSIENNLRTLKIEQVTLVHFRVMPGVGSFEGSMEAMYKMQEEGKILHVGVSNVSRGELETAMKMGEVASVENMYGHAQRTTLKMQHGGETRGGEEVLDICEQNGIPLVPYFSLFLSTPKKDVRIAEIAKKYNLSEVQANLAWLLHRSPWILPIPGTSSLAHFEENLKAADVALTPEDMDFLE